MSYNTNQHRSPELLQYCDIPAVPMLTHNDIGVVKIRRHALKILDRKRAGSEDLVVTSPLLGVGHQLPVLEAVVVCLLMCAIEHWDAVRTGMFGYCFHVGDRICLFQTVAESGIQFAFRMKELIVRINEDDGGLVAHDAEI